MEQATTHDPFEVVEDRLHQHFTVRAMRRPVMIWVVAPLMVLAVLTMLVVTVWEVEKGRHSEALGLFLGLLLIGAVLFITMAPFIWRSEASVSREQIVLRSWRGERRFSADEFDGFSWEHIPAGPKRPAYVRLWARRKGGPSLLLLNEAADGDEQARLQAAELVVRGLERALGAPSKD